MMADLRGFEYALEPLRQQRQWHLDKQLAELGRLQRDVTQVQGELARMKAQYDEAAQASFDAARRWFDVDAYRRGIAWLAALRSRLIEQEATLESLLRRKKAAHLACVAAQQKLDVVEQHREDSVADYVQAQNSRVAKQSDHDWIARQGQGVAESRV